MVDNTRFVFVGSIDKKEGMVPPVKAYNRGPQ